MIVSPHRPHVLIAKISASAVAAGSVMLEGIHRLGWIELRGINSQKEIRLTQLGLEALRAPV
jgi:hypothetical protein